jgi:hypothetical protein
MWLSQPRREQMRSIPPPSTLICAIGAAQLGQVQALRSSARQCGQRRRTTLLAGILCCATECRLP